MLFFIDFYILNHDELEDQHRFEVLKDDLI